MLQLKRKIIIGIVFAILFLMTTSAMAGFYLEEEMKKYEQKERTPEEIKALKIAEEVCKKEGWEWKYVSIEDHRDYWAIMTNSDADGCNAHIDIDKKTGKY